MTAAEERQALPCGHAFHKKCAVARLRHFNACPLPSCRQPVTTCLFCDAPLATAPSGVHKPVAFDIGEWASLRADDVGADLLNLEVNSQVESSQLTQEKARRIVAKLLPGARAASWAAVAPVQGLLVG